MPPRQSWCRAHFLPGGSSEWQRVCPRSGAWGLNHVLCLNDICIHVHVTVGRILASAVEYEAIKDMRVKSVGTGAETPVVKATGGWVGGCQGGCACGCACVCCVRVGVRVRVIVCVV